MDGREPVARGKKERRRRRRENEIEFGRLGLGRLDGGKRSRKWHTLTIEEEEEAKMALASPENEINIWREKSNIFRTNILQLARSLAGAYLFACLLLRYLLRFQTFSSSLFFVNFHACSCYCSSFSFFTSFYQERKFPFSPAASSDILRTTTCKKTQ